MILTGKKTAFNKTTEKQESAFSKAIGKVKNKLKYKINGKHIVWKHIVKKGQVKAKWEKKRRFKGEV